MNSKKIDQSKLLKETNGFLQNQINGYSARDNTLQATKYKGKKYFPLMKFI